MYQPSDHTGRPHVCCLAKPLGLTDPSLAYPSRIRCGCLLPAWRTGTANKMQEQDVAPPSPATTAYTPSEVMYLANTCVKQRSSGRLCLAARSPSPTIPSATAQNIHPKLTVGQKSKFVSKEGGVCVRHRSRCTWQKRRRAISHMGILHSRHTPFAPCTRSHGKRRIHFSTTCIVEYARNTSGKIRIMGCKMTIVEDEEDGVMK
ncbi:hypothetical protein GGR57DRAFT_355455 [Xylariaceae sp. FL1272]|nr:hypothetical protein GGR57DRAFT_355455 [Xylariaceae sp. FL1272]